MTNNLGAEGAPRTAEEARKHFRDREAARRRDPAYLADQLFRLADALQTADDALNDFWDNHLRNMPPERAVQFEALFPPYFEIEPYAAKIRNMADGWQVVIGAEADAS